MVLGIAAIVARLGYRAVPVRVNGQPGAVFLDAAGAVVGVVEVDVADDAVAAIRSVTNPDKLARVRLAQDGPAIGPAGRIA